MTMKVLKYLYLGLLFVSNSALAQIVTDPPQGRLTLTSHTPILSSDTPGATTLYYDSYKGGGYPNYNGSGDVKITITANEISDVIGASSPSGVLINQVVDEWALATGVICHATDGAGHGWSSDTGSPSNQARGTGYSQLDNITRYYITNANPLTHCYNGSTNEGSIAANQATYIGTFWTLKAAGLIDMVYHPAAVNGGANPCLCLFNGYNRVPAVSYSQDLASGANWAGTGLSTVGPADAGATGGGLNNRINWVDGLAAMEVDSKYSVGFVAVASNTAALVGPITDSSSANPFNSEFTNAATSTLNLLAYGFGSQAPLFGAHFIQAGEYSTSTNSHFAFAPNNLLSLRAQQ